ncbi:MAG: ABC transporter permease [Vicinamibacterales bacterium]
MQDLRLALRALWATPVVSAVAILSLALGIGGSTALFSLIASLLLRPLPVVEPDRLAIVSSSAPLDYRVPFSHATFDQIRQHREVFQSAFAFSNFQTFPVTIDGQAITAEGHSVSGDFFSTLGVTARLGRTLTPEDDVRGGGRDGPVAVVGYGFWQRRLGGRDDIIGARIAINHIPTTIVGVAPPEFLGVEIGRAFDVLVPINRQPLVGGAPLDDDAPYLNVMVRLRPALSLDEANAALQVIQPQIRAAAMPPTGTDEFLVDPLTLEPAGAGLSLLRERFARPLAAVFAVATLAVLIACANVANLMLGRAAGRRHEVAVRRAIGASRWRLARPLLAESVVLAAAGTCLGLLVARWACLALVAQLSTSGARIVLDLSLDWRILSFSAAAMVATTLSFGVWPALRSSRVDPMDTLRGRTLAAGVRDRRATDGLVIAQVAVSLMLVVATGLFVTTFRGLAAAPLGFDRDALVVAIRTPTVPAEERNVLYHRLVAAASEVAGVAAAGGSLNPPLVGTLTGDLVVSPPGTMPPPEAATIGRADFITPGWLRAYDTPLMAGRDLDDRDTAATPRVMLVNEAFVERFLPGQEPVGTSLAVTARLPPYGDFPFGVMTIVGVLGDTVYRSVGTLAEPALYFPLAQREDPLRFLNFYIVARASGGSAALLERGLTAALMAIEPNLHLQFRPVDQQVRDALVQQRLVAILSGFFGVLALALSAIGLYGVTSHAVARRRGEIGIRVALGAAPARVIRLVIGRVVGLLAMGLALGAFLSLWAFRLVSGLLYGLRPDDPSVLAGAGVLLAMVGIVAAGIPALHASRIDPAEALRES